MTIDQYINQPLKIEFYLKRLFHGNITIVEIGAAHGEDTIKYSKLFPLSKIFAFEPLFSNFEKAKANLTNYKVNNVSLNNCALSEKAGVVDFYVSSLENQNLENTISDGSRSSSMLEPDKHLEYYSQIKFNEKVQVNAVTLDAFCAENQVEHIDYVHLDVQGAELFVLNGARNMLQKTDAIWLEVSNVSLYKDQPKRDEIHRFMSSNGFVLLIDQVGGIFGDRMYINPGFYKKNRTMCIFIKLLESVKNVFS